MGKFLNVQMGMFFVIGLFSSAASFALPVETVIFDRDGNKLPDSQVNSDRVNWTLLNAQGNENLNGIALIDFGMGGGCSGTLIDAGSTDVNAPAYILTNGHCTGGDLMPPGEVIVDRRAPALMRAKFKYFQDARRAVVDVPIVRYAYATLTSTDIAIMQLGVTYRSLVNQGVVGFHISSNPDHSNEPVMMVGIPQSGVRVRYIRKSTCSLLEQVNVNEGGYSWEGSFRHQCSSVGGSSGTSMISLGTNEIVAINNTGVDDEALSQPECALDRPCEVNADGTTTTLVNMNYAQRVTDIPSCFESNGTFNLRKAGCQLPTAF